MRAPGYDAPLIRFLFPQDFIVCLFISYASPLVLFFTFSLLISRWGPGISRERRQGPAGDCPLHTGDPTPITPVKGTYSGEIETINRDPGMRFPGN